MLRAYSTLKSSPDLIVVLAVITSPLNQIVTFRCVLSKVSYWFLTNLTSKFAIDVDLDLGCDHLSSSLAGWWLFWAVMLCYESRRVTNVSHHIISAQHRPSQPGRPPQLTELVPRTVTGRPARHTRQLSWINAAPPGQRHQRKSWVRPGAWDRGLQHHSVTQHQQQLTTTGDSVQWGGSWYCLDP